MKVTKIEWSPLSTNFVDTRRVQLNERIVIKIYLKGEGVLECIAEKTYTTDGRSGPKLLDYLVDHYGDELNFIIFFIHDVLFQLQDYSFKFANDLLYACLRYAGHSWFKSTLLYWGVSGPTARKAYRTVDKWDLKNEGKARVYWGDK